MKVIQRVIDHMNVRATAVQISTEKRFLQQYQREFHLVPVYNAYWITIINEASSRPVFFSTIEKFCVQLFSQS